MNKARRAVLNKIINALTDLKDELETVKDEEEEARVSLIFFYIDFMLKWLYSGHLRLNILSKLISFIFMLLNVATRIV